MLRGCENIVGRKRGKGYEDMCDNEEISRRDDGNSIVDRMSG